MRALAVPIALSLMSTPALVASPQVEAAVRALQTVESDANTMKIFCELMRLDEQNAQKPVPFLEAKMDKLLDQLGADFAAAWEFAESVDEASEDGKVLNAALDRLSDRCPH